LYCEDTDTPYSKSLPRGNTEERVDIQAVAAYCIGGDGGFVSYDNPETVRIKAEFVKSRGLAVSAAGIKNMAKLNQF